MVNRKAMLSRMYRAERQDVAITNYGLAISFLQGVLPRALEPFPAARAAFDTARGRIGKRRRRRRPCKEVPDARENTVFHRHSMPRENSAKP